MSKCPYAFWRSSICIPSPAQPPNRPTAQTPKRPNASPSPHARNSVGAKHFHGREEVGQEGEPGQCGGRVGDGRARRRRKALEKQGKRSAAEFCILLCRCVEVQSSRATKKYIARLKINGCFSADLATGIRLSGAPASTTKRQKAKLYRNRRWRRVTSIITLWSAVFVSHIVPRPRPPCRRLQSVEILKCCVYCPMALRLILTLAQM